MAISEIPPQMVNLQTFSLSGSFFVSGNFRHLPYCYFVLNLSFQPKSSTFWYLEKTQSVVQCTLEWCSGTLLQGVGVRLTRRPSSSQTGGLGDISTCGGCGDMFWDGHK